MREIRIIDGEAEFTVRAYEYSLENEIHSPTRININGYIEGGRILTHKELAEKMAVRSPQFKNVIFNDPATIVYWTDGTKTVVKCQPGDTFDPLMGFLLAVFKKACGNKGNYNNALKKIVPGYWKEAQDATKRNGV